MKAEPIQLLAGLMRGRRTVVLSGAGISTESGIPDYRGPQGALRRRTPMQYREFIGSEAARRRYWARSFAGWALVNGAQPNAGHRAIARLEGLGAVQGVITQNVDGLHQAAGSRRVLELHGTLAAARCMVCGRTEPRRGLQERIEAANPGWRTAGGGGDATAEAAPDGDAETAAAALEGFSVPGCWYCGGILRPDVVFFGENVPVERVEAAGRMVDDADILLVTGSSLAVFSGYRFVIRALENDTPVAIINQGPTRADNRARVRIDRALGEALAELVNELEK